MDGVSQVSIKVGRKGSPGKWVERAASRVGTAAMERGAGGGGGGWARDKHQGPDQWGPGQPDRKHQESIHAQGKPPECRARELAI